MHADSPKFIAVAVHTVVSAFRGRFKAAKQLEIDHKFDHIGGKEGSESPADSKRYADEDTETLVPTMEAYAPMAPAPPTHLLWHNTSLTTAAGAKYEAPLVSKHTKLHRKVGGKEESNSYRLPSINSRSSINIGSSSNSPAVGALLQLKIAKRPHEV